MIDPSNAYKNHLIDSRAINFIQKCKQTILHTIAFVALPIIFCSSFIYVSLIKLQSLHLVAVILTPVLSLGVLVLVEGRLLIAGIINQIIVIRKAKNIGIDRNKWIKQMQEAQVDSKIMASCVSLSLKDQANGKYDFTHATYFAEQKRLEAIEEEHLKQEKETINPQEEAEEDNLRKEKEAIYQENCKTVTHFCAHVFKFDDPRLNALLTEFCKLEAHQWKEVISNQHIDLFNSFPYSDSKIPFLVYQLQIRLHNQLYLSENIEILLEDNIDSTLIVRALNWLLYAPKPIPWDQLDLTKDIQSITLTSLPANSSIQKIEGKDVKLLMKKIIYSVNQKNYPQAKAYALSQISKIQDPDLLTHLKPELLEIEQKLEQLFNSHSRIVDLAKECKHAEYIIELSQIRYSSLKSIEKNQNLINHYNQKLRLIRE